MRPSLTCSPLLSLDAAGEDSFHGAQRVKFARHLQLRRSRRGWPAGAAHVDSRRATYRRSFRWPRRPAMRAASSLTCWALAISGQTQPPARIATASYSARVRPARSEMATSGSSSEVRERNSAATALRDCIDGGRYSEALRPSRRCVGVRLMTISTTTCSASSPGSMLSAGEKSRSRSSRTPSDQWRRQRPPLDPFQDRRKQPTRDRHFRQLERHVLRVTSVVA